MARKINIVLEHIILCEIIIDILELCCGSDKLIIVVCRRRRSTVHRIAGRRCTSSIPDMCRAVIRCIGVHYDIGASHIRRFEEADVLAHDLDIGRRDRAHVDNIGDSRR